MKLNKKKIALIIGAGDYLGSELAKKFAVGGLSVVVTRRRGDLTKLVTSIVSLGGEAIPFHTDARNENQVIELIKNIETKLGQIDILIYNVGGNVKYKILNTSSRIYRKVWEMCAFGGFLNAKEVLKYMIPRKKGTIIFTGASASLRGKEGFSAFSGGKQALRALAQSLAQEVSLKGIHVSHVVIDGLIENSNTKKLFPDEFKKRPSDGILKPKDIAEIYWQIYLQPKSSWSFETDIRPYSEKW